MTRMKRGSEDGGGLERCWVASRQKQAMKGLCNFFLFFFVFFSQGGGKIFSKFQEINQNVNRESCRHS